MFYLTCPDDIPRHTQWDIAHAVSSDLTTWERKGTVVKRGEEKEWDYSCATGSVIRFNGRYWMAYTGNWRGPVAAVGLAVSDDLSSWKKCDYNPVTTIDTRYYEPVGSGERTFPHWRDPFLFEHDGRVYHYTCASKNYGSPDSRGTVGFARTEDMVHWEVLPPPELDEVAQELECPQLRSNDGTYYLIFSSHPSLFSQRVQEQYADTLRQSTYCMTAPSPFGPFTSGPVRPIVPPDFPEQPYACQIVQWQGKWYLLGTVWNETQDYVCDPMPVTPTPQGLEIKQLR